MNPSAIEIPQHIRCFSGEQGMAAIEMQAMGNRVTVYLHGGHITSFQHHQCGEIFFLSQHSHYQSGKAIRGGIPVIFPWFGAKVGHPAHGYARVSPWQASRSEILPDGSVSLELSLPNPDSLQVTARITLGESLNYALTCKNLSDSAQAFDACLHSYFAVSDVRKVAIMGLDAVPYHDFVLHQDCIEDHERITIDSEIDRLYQPSGAVIELLDPCAKRIITIEKTNALSTVVWNPWIEKSSGMSDMGKDDYLRMICIESGNVKDCQWTLGHGEQRTMTTTIRCRQA